MLPHAGQLISASDVGAFLCRYCHDVVDGRIQHPYWKPYFVAEMFDHAILRTDKILKRMNRTYTREHFIKLSNKIRSTLPGVGISTDIIVGFPGETEQDFNDTINLMNEVCFDSAFTFKYSPRKGTKATEYDDHLVEKIKQERLAQVAELQKSHTAFRNEKFVGNIENILIDEKYRGNGYGEKIVNKLLEMCKEQKCYRVDLNCSYELEHFYQKN